MAIRVAPANTLVFDQLDWFEADYFTRIAGVAVGSIALTVFCNNAVVAWPLVTGVSVPDAEIRPGSVYYQQIVAGYYGVRVKFNALGYWRLDLRYATGGQSISLDYDVVSLPDMTSLGLKASFTGRPCG